MLPFLHRCWTILRGRAFDAAPAEEVEFRRAMTQRDLESRGVHPRNGASAAYRALGSVAPAQDPSRDIWRPRWLFGVGHDIRIALRTLRAAPAFAAVAILSLALGAGANTAIFELLNAIRLRSLPVAAPDELVQLRLDDMTHARGTWLRDAALTNPLWEQIRHRHDTLSGLFAWADEPLELSQRGEFRKIAALWVSGEFFEVLGIHPEHGRLFTAEDDRRGCGTDAGVVISHGFWQREFGGARAIVGQETTIGKLRTRIIGVTPPQFFGVEVGRTFDVALPICAEPARHGTDSRLDAGTFWWLTVMGRLKPGASIAAAAAAFKADSAALFAATLPPNYPQSSVTPYLHMTLVASPAVRGVSRLREQYSTPLVLLLAITGIVLLIACTNLAHLMLARSHTRRREMAVRLALGASGLRLARQLLTESLLLAAAGALLGLFVARALSQLLVSRLAPDTARVFLDLSVDLRTLAFVTLLAVLTCLVFAAVPMLRAATALPGAILAAGARGLSGGRERTAVRRTLMASQIALSLVLLAGTFVFVRSLQRLEAVDPGFQERYLVVSTVSFATLRVPPDRTVAFRTELLARVRATGGVADATELAIVPLSGGNWNNRIWMEGSDPIQARIAFRNMIGTRYFRTLGTPLVEGREFDDHDLTSASAKVAIVNEAFVRLFAPGARPLGRRLWVEGTPSDPSAPYEIVGVAKNTKYRELREDDQPIVFVPLSQAVLHGTGIQLLVRSNTNADTVIASLRRSLDAVNPTLRYSFRVFDTIVRESLLRERLMASLAGPFGALAVILTVLGLYGVTSYIVAQRTNEIAIRLALGADRRAVVGLVVRDGAVVLAAGLVAGVLLTIAAGRAAETLLFELRPYDPLSLTLASAALGMVAMVATVIPAWRASGMEPVMALRQD